MGSYTLSGAADADIEAIAKSSLEQWGVTRAERYILGLHDLFQQLAEFPDMGLNVSHVRLGYFRMQSGSHLVFYRKIDRGIRIVRILHQLMDVARHL